MCSKQDIQWRYLKNNPFLINKSFTENSLQDSFTLNFLEFLPFSLCVNVFFAINAMRICYYVSVPLHTWVKLAIWRKYAWGLVLCEIWLPDSTLSPSVLMTNQHPKL